MAVLIRGFPLIMHATLSCESAPVKCADRFLPGLAPVAPPVEGVLIDVPVVLSPRLADWMRAHKVSVAEYGEIGSRDLWRASAPLRGILRHSYGPTEESALRSLARRLNVAPWDQEEDDGE